MGSACIDEQSDLVHVKTKHSESPMQCLYKLDNYNILCSS